MFDTSPPAKQPAGDNRYIYALVAMLILTIILVYGYRKGRA